MLLVSGFFLRRSAWSVEDVGWRSCDHLRDTPGYDLAHWLDRAAATLVGEERVILCGHSSGDYPAQCLTACLGEHIVHLYLFSALVSKGGGALESCRDSSQDSLLGLCRLDPPRGRVRLEDRAGLLRLLGTEVPTGASEPAQLLTDLPRQTRPACPAIYAVAAADRLSPPLLQRSFARRLDVRMWEYPGGRLATLVDLCFLRALIGSNGQIDKTENTRFFIAMIWWMMTLLTTRTLAQTSGGGPNGGPIMIERRPFDRLSHTNHGWLNARHRFSFADYYDPERENWGRLRVWNDDEIAVGSGLPPHPHRDMGIITYVHEGAITHQDSLGNKGRTEAGDVQVMSAGTGIVHSEYNLGAETTRVFQIWIIPDRRGDQPRWGSKSFPKAERDGRLVTLASGDEQDSEALHIRADAEVATATLRAGQSAEYALEDGRCAYPVPVAGSIEVNGVCTEVRDGLAVRDEPTLRVTALGDSEVPLMEVA